MTIIEHICTEDHSNPMFIAMLASAGLRSSDNIAERIDGYVHTLGLWFKHVFPDVKSAVEHTTLHKGKLHIVAILTFDAEMADDDPEPGLFIHVFNSTLTIAEATRLFFEKLVHDFSEHVVSERIDDIVGHLKIHQTDDPEFDV